MMYAKPDKFEIDFIKRTKKILEDYSGDYDVTLFLNAMLGLLIIPKEKYNDLIDDSFVSPEQLKKITTCCKFPKDKEPHDLKYIIRRMRNAAGHGHLEFEAEKTPYGEIGKEIKRIIFYDDLNAKKKGDDYRRYEFSAKIEISFLREIVNAFSDSILKMDEMNGIQ